MNFNKILNTTIYFSCILFFFSCSAPDDFQGPQEGFENEQEILARESGEYFCDCDTIDYSNDKELISFRDLASQSDEILEYFTEYVQNHCPERLDQIQIGVSEEENTENMVGDTISAAIDIHAE